MLAFKSSLVTKAMLAFKVRWSRNRRYLVCQNWFYNDSAG